MGSTPSTALACAPPICCEARRVKDDDLYLAPDVSSDVHLLRAAKRIIPHFDQLQEGEKHQLCYLFFFVFILFFEVGELFQKCADIWIKQAPEHGIQHR